MQPTAFESDNHVSGFIGLPRTKLYLKRSHHAAFFAPAPAITRTVELLSLAELVLAESPPQLEYPVWVDLHEHTFG